MDLAEESRKLRRQFNFTDTDLAANRRGFLSDRQRKSIAQPSRAGKAEGLRWGVKLLGGAWAFVVLEAFLLRILGKDELQGEFSAFRTEAVMGALILGAIILLAAASGIFLIVRHFAKKPSKELISIRGSARLEQAAGDRSAGDCYFLKINDQRFPGDSSLSDVIIPGKEYVVYYLPGSSRIMSAELIPS